VWIGLLPLIILVLPKDDPWLDHANYIWWRVWVMKLLIFWNIIQIIIWNFRISVQLSLYTFSFSVSQQLPVFLLSYIY
jgi:hypothetical protein